MKHIVIDARIIATSTGRYVERLVHYLDQLDGDHRYTIIVLKKDEAYWQPTRQNFTVIGCDYRNYSFGEQLGFWRLLRQLKPDLVHFCMPQQPIFFRGLKVTTFHDLTLLRTYNSDKNWLVFHVKQLIGRAVFAAAAHTSRFIITPTDYVKRDVETHYHLPPDKVVRTYEAAELRTTTERPYAVPSSDFILYVGQQSDYKNIRRLQAAHAMLLSDHPDLQLVLVGKIDAAAEKNQRYFESIGATHVHFTGFVDDDQLAWLFRHTKAYVFPSLMEGFGLPGLEAMTMGAPVASSNASCLPEVYGDAAVYFDPKDPADMAAAIGRIIDDPRLRDELVKKGYQQAARYSWRRMAEQTLEVYMRALVESR